VMNFTVVSLVKTGAIGTLNEGHSTI
jgi:hypothetical protein